MIRLIIQSRFEPLHFLAAFLVNAAVITVFYLAFTFGTYMLFGANGVYVSYWLISGFAILLFAYLLSESIKAKRFSRAKNHLLIILLDLRVLIFAEVIVKAAF